MHPFAGLAGSIYAQVCVGGVVCLKTNSGRRKW